MNRFPVPDFGSQSNASLITYHGEAESLPSALKKLSVLVKQNLVASDEYSNDIVAIDVTNVTADYLLKHIANVELAEWVGSSKFRKLVPSDTLIQRHKSRVIEQTAAKIKMGFIQQKADDLAHVSNSITDSDQKLQAELQSLEDDLRLNLDFKVLATVEPGQRVVFSSHPNATQLPFPIEANNDVQQILKLYEDQSAFKLNYIYQIPMPPFYLPSRFELIDSKGANLVDNDNSFTIGRLNGGVAANPVQGDMIELSGRARVIQEGFVRFGAGDKETKEVEINAVNLLSDPVQNDPLLPAGQYVTKMAAKEGGNLVALLSDETWGFQRKLNLTPGEIKQQIESDEEEISQNPNWLEISPLHPTLDRESRLSREFLKWIVTTSKKSPIPAFDEMVTVAMTEHGSSSAFLAGFGVLVVPNWTSFLMEFDHRLLNIYGRLSAENKAELEAGRTLSMSQVPADAARYIRLFAFGYGPRLFDNSKKNSRVDPISEIYRAPKNEADRSNAYKSEPTEVAPNGFPDGPNFNGTFSTVNAYMPVFEEKKGFTTKYVNSLHLDENELTAFNYQMSQSLSNSKMIGCKIGVRHILNIKIYLSPTIYVGGEITNDTFPSSVPTTPMDQLPKAVLDKMALFKKYNDDKTAGNKPRVAP